MLGYVLQMDRRRNGGGSMVMLEIMLEGLLKYILWHQVLVIKSILPVVPR